MQIIYNERDEYIFHTWNFVQMQSKPYEKYMSLADVDMSAGVAPKDVIGILDKYLLHTVEEIAEAVVEIDNCHRDYLYEELTDVLMYMGTVGAIIYHNAAALGKAKPDLIVLEEEKGQDHNVFFREQLLEALRGLMEIRRVFPERKWHKPHPKEVNVSERVDGMLAPFSGMVANILRMLTYLGTPEELQEMIIKKHRAVMGLPMQPKDEDQTR